MESSLNDGGGLAAYDLVYIYIQYVQVMAWNWALHSTTILQPFQRRC